MRAVQITRFDGPEVLDVSNDPEPGAGNGQKLYDVPPPASTTPTPITPCPSTEMTWARLPRIPQT
jgi:hypothetical protein